MTSGAGWGAALWGAPPFHHKIVQIVQISVHAAGRAYVGAMLDLLSNILTNLSLRGTLYFRTSFTKPWGVAVPRYENVARFHFAQAVRAFLEGEDSAKWGLAAFSDPRVSRALGAFHKAPATAWTVETLAEVAGMSRTSFAVQFQKMMRMTPLEYVTKWRMEVAKKVMLGPGASLTDAAESAGYASDSAFTRAFKKETGMTLAEFKKENLSVQSAV